MTKSAAIPTALAQGATTLEEIAERLGCDRRNVAVTLCRLDALGLIERAGTMYARRIGRPVIAGGCAAEPELR